MWPESARRTMSGVVCLVLLFASFGLAPAQTSATGRIVGTVLDRESGEPLIGGQVVIPEAGMGNFTGADGSFFIKDVPAGEHTITSEYLGYRAASELRRVGPGETVRVDFRLSPDAIAADAIVAVIAREPWSVPERVAKLVALVPQPTDMPDMEPPRCAPRMINHGSYIAGGRWENQSSVGDMECENYDLDPCDRIEPVDPVTEPQGLGG